MTVCPKGQGLGWRSVFDADAKEAVVGLAAVSNYEFSELARKICVVGIKVERLLKELPDIRVRFGNGGGDDLGYLRSLRSGHDIAVGWEPKIAPAGNQIRRIPGAGDVLGPDAMGDSHPCTAETVALFLGVLQRGCQDVFPVFLEPLASDGRLRSGWRRLHEVRNLQDF